MNSFKSSHILSDTPLSRTTDSIGRRFRGAPNCLHSDPSAVYRMVLPSVSFKANNLAGFRVIFFLLNSSRNFKFEFHKPSSNIPVNSFLFRPKAVKVTVSHGIPICKSKVCCSRVRSTRIQLFLYLKFKTKAKLSYRNIWGCNKKMFKILGT